MSLTHDPRGSVWRRWDLHVHTPASPLSDFGDPGDNATWETYAAGIIDAVGRHEIEAVCLSDYFTLDGYAQLVERGIYDPDRTIWTDGDTEVSLLVLPGIELRLSQITHDSHAINLHVIFDPKRIPMRRLRGDFLSNLRLDPKHGGQELSASAAHLLALGKAAKLGVDPDLNEDLSGLDSGEKRALLGEAVAASAVAADDLIEVLRTLDRTVPGGRSFLIAIAGSGHGGLHELPWDGHAGTIRQSLLRAADLVFSSNEGDRAFLLGQKEDTSVDEVIQRFRSLKPCVWGSDAKEVDNLLHPSSGQTHRYTWIKADRSFEGLKQLLYEPTDRVTIQETHPDDRPWNTVIDAVRFLDDTETGLVSGEWITLNPALTTIIGGKSAGKSLLLYFIAKTVDAPQVRERFSSEDLPYDLLERDLSFEVRWKNGDVQTLGGAEVAPSRITYLPQNYINQLAEPDSQHQLEGVIMRLLREEEEFAAAEDALRDEVDEHRRVVADQLPRLFELRRQAQTVRERIADLGKESAISAEIDRLQEEQAAIRKAAGMEEQEQKRFDALRGERTELDEIAQRLRSEDQQLSEFAATIQIIGDRVSTEIADHAVAPKSDDEESIPQRLAGVAKGLGDTLAAAFTEAAAEITRARTAIESELAATARRAAEVDKDLEPYHEKLQSRARAESLAEAEAKQRESLLAIQEEAKREERLSRRLSQTRERLVQAYRGIHEAFDDFVSSWLDGGDVEIAGDVRLRAETRFDERAFSAQLQEGLDGRQRLDGIQGIENLSDGYAFPGIEAHCDNLRTLLADLTASDDDRSLKLKKSYSPSDVASALVRDHFGLHLTLQHEGDELHRMSPGKRGMILLRLLLEKSDATHPILIDQPEDNLDNRTVFTQLRHAVRERKRIRQIIVVSHNANLVVSTDSECVLVAHQYGPGEVPGGLTQFDYGGGALEHSSPRSEHASIIGRQGTREHVCEILEGGEEAFLDRQKKYEFPSN